MLFKYSLGVRGCGYKDGEVPILASSLDHEPSLGWGMLPGHWTSAYLSGVCLGMADLNWFHQSILHRPVEITKRWAQNSKFYSYIWNQWFDSPTQEKALEYRCWLQSAALGRWHYAKWGVTALSSHYSESLLPGSVRTLDFRVAFRGYLCYQEMTCYQTR